MGHGRALGWLVVGVIALAPLSAGAAQHEWKIKEVYTNSDGRVQFIELFTTAEGQGILATHVIKVTNGTTSQTFTFPTNLAGVTANRHLLIATPGFSRVPGSVVPDYNLPCGPFIPIGATGTITIEFGGAGQTPYDSISFDASTLPTDNTSSLTDSNLGAGTSLSSGTNSPANGSATGTLSLSACLLNGTCQPCDDGLYCNGPETCAASACTAVAPCAKQCIEASDTCVDCIDTSHCSDSNPCTNDICNGAMECENPARTGSCDDGLFCNGADTCVSAVCTHAGTPCPAQNCNEGPDTCGDCTGASDCEDGQSCTTDTCNSGDCARANAADGSECDTDATFCNGVGICASGTCGNVEAPCDTGDSCDEGTRACSATAADAGLDAGGPGTNDPDGGGCCQANRSAAPLAAPLLLIALASLMSRARRRRTR